ncbi:MAG: alpha/beta hydrolase [Pseudomonadota bacterium]
MLFQTGIDLLRLQGDVVWAGAELTVNLIGAPYLAMVARKGDGHTPVMTLPGFTASEMSLTPLNRFFNANGYIASSWELGTNRGVRDIEHLENMSMMIGAGVERLADKHGRKVALIGQSLGGVFAREVARRLPELVDRVITLGCPAHVSVDSPNVNAMVARIMALYAGRPVADLLAEVQALDFDLSEPPAGVPLVSIFSPYDGVVPKSTTQIPQGFLDAKDGTPRENIEIVCSHCGMGVNPLVLLAIADRLAEDRTNWVDFDPMKYAIGNYAVGPLRLASRFFYPSRLPPLAA